jgi:hypothetical protein
MPDPPEIIRAGSKAFYSPRRDRMTLPRASFSSALKRRARRRCMSLSIMPTCGIIREAFVSRDLQAIRFDPARCIPVRIGAQPLALGTFRLLPAPSTRITIHQRLPARRSRPRLRGEFRPKSNVKRAEIYNLTTEDQSERTDRSGQVAQALAPTKVSLVS